MTPPDPPVEAGAALAQGSTASQQPPCSPRWLPATVSIPRGKPTPLTQPH